MQTVRTAVIGATGYAGQEVVSYLARHPVFQIAAVTSRQSVGQPLGQSVAGLPKPLAQLTFSAGEIDSSLPALADLFFLAVPHGTAVPYVQALRAAGKTVVDLSADFRTQDPAVYREFYDHDHPATELLPQAVYGLPELHREKLKTAKLIAAPGCFPTSIILPLAPFLRQNVLQTETISIASLSGASGAGRKLEARLLFGEVAENFYPYGVPKHRHLGEIEQELSLVAGRKIIVSFVPHLVPVFRGMVTTTSAVLAGSFSEEKLRAILSEAYAQEPFIEILGGEDLPQARSVAHSNRLQIALRHDPRTNRLLLFSALDNLGKGNASQAIQAANLAYGLKETTGLAS